MGQTSLAELKTKLSPTVQENVTAGFGTLAGFDLMQRGANLLANSTIVPVQYRAVAQKKDRYGNITAEQNNPAAISNCVVALNMAQRMGADPLMIMQNLYIVEGRPAWSSQYIIASINACGKYSPLRFKIEALGEKTVEYVETKWENNKPVKIAKKQTIQNMRCIAWAIEKNTVPETTLESPPVTIEMAVQEGWYTKNGSKWQTMPEVMLRYRAASFFGKLYAPELLMGIQTAEEMQDSTVDYEKDSGGVYTMSVNEIRKPEGETGTDPSPVEQPEQPETPAPTPNPEEKQDTKPAQKDKPEYSGLEKVAEKEKHPLVDEPPRDTVQCPNNGKYVDVIDCAGCSQREGCPSFDID